MNTDEFLKTSRQLQGKAIGRINENQQEIHGRQVGNHWRAYWLTWHSSGSLSGGWGATRGASRYATWKVFRNGDGEIIRGATLEALQATVERLLVDCDYEP